MRHNVTIETRKLASGHFETTVTKGPQWLRGRSYANADRIAAYREHRDRIVAKYPEHNFGFVHTDNGE